MADTTPVVVDDLLKTTIPDAPELCDPVKLMHQGYLRAKESIERLPTGDDAIQLYLTDPMRTCLEAYDADEREWYSVHYVGTSTNNKHCVQMLRSGNKMASHVPDYLSVDEEEIRIAPEADVGQFIIEVDTEFDPPFTLAIECDDSNRAFIIAAEYCCEGGITIASLTLIE